MRMRVIDSQLYKNNISSCINGLASYTVQPSDQCSQALFTLAVWEGISVGDNVDLCSIHKQGSLWSGESRLCEHNNEYAIVPASDHSPV